MGIERYSEFNLTQERDFGTLHFGENYGWHVSGKVDMQDALTEMADWGEGQPNKEIYATLRQAVVHSLLPGSVTLDQFSGSGIFESRGPLGDIDKESLAPFQRMAVDAIFGEIEELISGVKEEDDQISDFFYRINYTIGTNYCFDDLFEGYQVNLYGAYADDDYISEDERTGHEELYEYIGSDLVKQDGIKKFEIFVKDTSQMVGSVYKQVFETETNGVIVFDPKDPNLTQLKEKN